MTREHLNLHNKHQLQSKPWAARPRSCRETSLGEYPSALWRWSASRSCDWTTDMVRRSGNQPAATWQRRDEAVDEEPTESCPPTRWLRIGICRWWPSCSWWRPPVGSSPPRGSWPALESRRMAACYGRGGGRGGGTWNRSIVRMTSWVCALCCKWPLGGHGKLKALIYEGWKFITALYRHYKKSFAFLHDTYRVPRWNNFDIFL